MAEKPLEKMTSTELREVAKELPQITGAHGMNKVELLDAIRDAKGIVVDGPKKDASLIRTLKGKIAELKRAQVAAAEGEDKVKATRIRKRISKLKKKARRAAA